MNLSGPRLPGLLVAPVRSLFLLTLGMLAMVALAALIAQVLPSLGVSLEPADEGAGLLVTEVRPGSPADGRLASGDVVVALVTGDGSRVDLAGYRPHLEPHGLPTFAALRGYLKRQGEVLQAVSGEEVTLVTTRGKIPLQPAASRSIESLSATFWMFHLFGGLALLVGGAVWLSRRERQDAGLLALSGLGFFLATWFNSIYLAREVAMPAGLFDLLLRGNHLALTLMIGAILLLFVHYPRAVNARWPTYLVVLSLAGHQLNENLQWLDWPLHSFYLPLIVLYGVALVLAYRQWRLSAGEPVDRASLKWVFLAILMTMGTCMVIYFVPPILGKEALLPQVAMVGFAVLMYLGLALGVIRYRLFQLEHWWFEIWFWFLAGAMLIVVDLGLVWLIQLEQAQALGLSVLIVGWLYFPIRELIGRRLMWRRQGDVVDLLPTVVEQMLDAPGRDEMEARWSSILGRAFMPLTTTFDRAFLDRTTLSSNGERLYVPGVFAGRWVLQYARKGQRLFSPRDVGEADSLRLVARQVCDVRFAREEGAVTERRRIVRDLHDDVGNRLLSLVRFSESPRQEQLARATLKALRESMAALDPAREVRLEPLLGDLKEQMRERYPERSDRLHWEIPSAQASSPLTPRQAINIRRILDEAIGNAHEHANPRRIEIKCQVERDGVLVSITNDGVSEGAGDPADALRGRGLMNIETRAKEVGGHVNVLSSPPQYRVEVCLPVPTVGAG